jgi:hypothetical protein
MPLCTTGTAPRAPTGPSKLRADTPPSFPPTISDHSMGFLRRGSTQPQRDPPHQKARPPRRPTPILKCPERFGNFQSAAPPGTGLLPAGPVPTAVVPRLVDHLGAVARSEASRRNAVRKSATFPADSRTNCGPARSLFRPCVSLLMAPAEFLRSPAVVASRHSGPKPDTPPHVHLPPRPARHNRAQSVITPRDLRTLPLVQSPPNRAPRHGIGENDQHTMNSFPPSTSIDP